jgi:hypothetical protein
MSSVSSVAAPSVAPRILSCQAPQRPTDGDTPAQEAAESTTTKRAENQNGGLSPGSAGLVNKTA